MLQYRHRQQLLPIRKPSLSPRPSSPPQVSLNGYLGFSDAPFNWANYPLSFPVQAWPDKPDPSFIGPFYSKCNIGELRPGDDDSRRPGVYWRYVALAFLEFLCSCVFLLVSVLLFLFFSGFPSSCGSFCSDCPSIWSSSSSCEI